MRKKGAQLGSCAPLHASCWSTGVVPFRDQELNCFRSGFAGSVGPTSLIPRVSSEILPSFVMTVSIDDVNDPTDAIHALMAGQTCTVGIERSTENSSLG